jgi:hypothetical protein
MRCGSSHPWPQNAHSVTNMSLQYCTHRHLDGRQQSSHPIIMYCACELRAMCLLITPLIANLSDTSHGLATRPHSFCSLPSFLSFFNTCGCGPVCVCAEHLELTALPPCEGVCLHHLGPLTRLTQLSLGKRLQLTAAGLRCLSSLRLPALKLLLVEGADTRAAPARELLAALAAAAPAVEVIKVGRCRGVSSVDIGQLLGQCRHLRHLEVVGAKLGKAPVVWAVWGAERRSQLQSSTQDAAPAAAGLLGCMASSSRSAVQGRAPAGTTGPGWHPIRFVGARSSEVHRPDGSLPSMFDVTAAGSGAGLSGQQLWDWSWLNR